MPVRSTFIRSLSILFLFSNSAQSQQSPGPANVTAEQTGTAEVRLQWDAVPGAKGYVIQRSVWPNGFQRFASDSIVTQTTYIDTDVRPGVKHAWRVAAKLGGDRVSTFVRSNELIPGGRPRPLQIARGARVDARSDSEPVIPSVDATPYDTLTPAVDTISTAQCTADAQRRRPARANVAAQRRSGSDTIHTQQSEAPERTPLQETYFLGKCKWGNLPGYPDLWTRVAEISGLPHDSLVAAWKEVATLSIIYRHIAQREPTREEVLRELPRLKRGAPEWKRLWRDLAQSDEHERRFGYWAPAPIATPALARSKFGLSFTPAAPQICFGAMGPNCGGAPTPNVSPKWFGYFRLPDGSEFGYVSVGVGVGSVFHDSMCLVDRTGLNCDGLGAGDLVKHGGWPAAMEWNKAAWNVLENRVWRDIFGPYPTAAHLQLEFYDDIRITPARPGKMAPVLSMLTTAMKTEAYKGPETKRTQALKAPPGTWMDDTDAAYCATTQFEQIIPARQRERSAFGICGRK